MTLARFVAFHELPEHAPDTLAPLTFAVMIARSRAGVVVVFNRHREVWELAGGFIDPGESPRRAAERELREEAGCMARNSRWLGVVEVNDGRAHFGGVIGCEVDEVPEVFANEEVAAVGYWLREASPQPLGNTDAALLGRFG